MIVVLFEVNVKKEGMAQYLKIAAALAQELSTVEGFISAERFSSLKNDGKLLSVSIWQSEEAIEKWRNHAKHRLGQQQGLEQLFDSYKITVLSSLREYTNTMRVHAPQDSNEHFQL